LTPPWLAACDSWDVYEDPSPRHLKDVHDLKHNNVGGVNAGCHLDDLSNDPLGNFGDVLTHEINHIASVRTNEPSAGEELLDGEARWTP